MSRLFPILDSQDIADCFVQLKISIFEKNIKSLSNFSLKTIFRKFLEFFAGKTFLKIYQPKLLAMEYLTYPELHEESTAFLTEHRCLQEILKKSSITNFCIFDWLKIDNNRIEELLSGLINFARFKQKNLLTLKKFNDIYPKILFSSFEISSRLRSLKKKIFFLRKNFHKNMIENKNIEIKRRKHFDLVHLHSANLKSMRHYNNNLIQRYYSCRENLFKKPNNTDRNFVVIKKKKTTLSNHYYFELEQQNFNIVLFCYHASLTFLNYLIFLNVKIQKQTKFNNILYKKMSLFLINLALLLKKKKFKFVDNLEKNYFKKVTFYNYYGKTFNLTRSFHIANKSRYKRLIGQFTGRPNFFPDSYSKTDYDDFSYDNSLIQLHNSDTEYAYPHILSIIIKIALFDWTKKKIAIFKHQIYEHLCIFP